MKGRRVLVIDDVITAGKKKKKCYYELEQIDKYYEEKYHDRYIQI